MKEPAVGVVTHTRRGGATGFCCSLAPDEPLLSVPHVRGTKTGLVVEVHVVRAEIAQEGGVAVSRFAQDADPVARRRVGPQHRQARLGTNEPEGAVGQAVGDDVARQFGTMDDVVVDVRAVDRTSGDLRCGDRSKRDLVRDHGVVRKLVCADDRAVEVIAGNLVTANLDGSDRTIDQFVCCLLYTSPSPRDQRGSRMPSSA